MGGPDIGWLAPGGPTAEAYVASIERYAAELERDGVLGAFIFEAGAFEDWRSFEVLGSCSVAEWLAKQAVAHPSAPQGHSHGNGGKSVADFVIGQGIRDKAAQIGATNPIMDEEYLKDGQGKDTYSYAIYDDGKTKWEIRYYPKLNRTYAVRLA